MLQVVPSPSATPDGHFALAKQLRMAINTSPWLSTQVARLCSELKVEAGRELLTMVDQEGGLVARLGPPFTRIPPARVVGSTRDTQAASAVGFILGRELRAVGIDMNLAPVLDVDTNPENPVIGTRAFGRSPDLVAGMGCALIRAMQREGVAACPKHFPGHGDTAADSHHELPVLEHSISRLLEVELPPFAKAVEAEAAAVMIAHVVVPAMEDQQQQPRPASMSRSVVTYLREQLHFEGLILSDCLEMGAILNNFSVGEAAVEAVTAGVDMVLVSKHEHLQLAVIDALTRAVKEGKLPYRRIMEAGQRIAAVTRLFAPPETTRNTLLERGFHESRLGVIGCREHQDMVANIECQAAALNSQCS